VGFLTILPVSPKDVRPVDLGRSIKFFPLAGTILGGMVWGVWWLSGRIFSDNIAAWLTVFIGAALAGFIHWDGWADTADGLGSKDPQKSLMIMKDSRLGAFGAIALCFLILGKVWLITKAMSTGIFTSLSLFTVSRWSMVLLIVTQPSVSQGLLQSFAMNRKHWDLGIATVITAFVIGFGWPHSLILFAATLFILPLVVWAIKKRFGGITGDILGAVNELVELTGLLILNIKP
jgi:adenosylcobinamide-GDP ribazoletransferase